MLHNPSRMTRLRALQRRTPQRPPPHIEPSGPPAAQTLNASPQEFALARAEQHRVQGNAAYQREEYQTAELLYTQGIQALAGAANISQQQARLLQNRAMALSARVCCQRACCLRAERAVRRRDVLIGGFFFFFCFFSAF